MSHFAIAGLQLALSNADNLEAIAGEIEQTKKRFPWLDMIVLSELATYGISKKFAMELPSQTETFYCQLAKKHNIWLIPGSLYEQSPDGIFNTTSIINNHGEVVNRYRKIFPFYPYESGVKEGSEFVVFDVPAGRIGIAICYDLWFPEVARKLVTMGAEVLIYPTLTNTIDRQLECVLSQSTAITNQAYVISINGSLPMANGQSMVVDPQGQVVYQAGENQEIIQVDIDFDLVRRTRERGTLGLGQPLKSFRDNPLFSPVNQYVAGEDNELNSLGELSVPCANKK